MFFLLEITLFRNRSAVHFSVGFAWLNDFSFFVSIFYGVNQLYNQLMGGGRNTALLGGAYYRTTDGIHLCFSSGF